MMTFRTIKASTLQILADAAAARFNVVGYQKQTKNESESKLNNRTVQLFYKDGDFPNAGGANTDVTKHTATYALQLTVSAPSKVDLNVLQNPTSTEGQLSAAVNALQESAAICDDLFDELVDIVYQIIMDARNYDLGQPKGTIADRWISSAQKDDPVPRGALTTLTGMLLFTVKMMETVDGDTGVAAVSTSTELGGITADPSDPETLDTTQKTGTESLT
jgi:hypothetical protein